MRLLVFSIVFLISGGCSLKSLYTQLDWLIPQYIDGYVNLNEIQQAELERRLQDSLHWHRYTQLPIYAKWLAQLREDVERGLTVARVESNLGRLEQHWRVLMNKVSRDMATLLPGINAAQREELFEGFARKNKEYREEFIHRNAQELRTERIDRVQRNFERWLGPLSKLQMQLLIAATDKLQPLAEEQLVTRLRWQAGLKQLLTQNMPDDKLQAALQKQFLYLEQFRSERYQQMMETNRGVLIKLIVDVISHASKQQKIHLSNEIDYYTEIFTELAAQQDKQAAQCLAC